MQTTRSFHNCLKISKNADDIKCIFLYDILQCISYSTRAEVRSGSSVFLQCVCSRGHIFSSTIMKLGQNACLDEISDEFEKWVMSGKKLGH